MVRGSARAEISVRYALGRLGLDRLGEELLTVGAVDAVSPARRRASRPQRARRSRLDQHPRFMGRISARCVAMSSMRMASRKPSSPLCRRPRIALLTGGAALCGHGHPEFGHYPGGEQMISTIKGA